MNYDGQKICGVTVEGVAGQISKWGKPHLLIGIAGTLSQFTNDDFAHAVLSAAAAWSKVCGVTFALTTGTPDILVTTGNIDGPSGTLAWSELPGSGTTQRLTQKYDAAEAWIIALNPPASRIDLTRVVTHEIGHAIGIPHIGSGNLMAPTYSTKIREPQAGDISEAIGRYGNPRPTVPPSTPTPGEPGEGLTIWIPGAKVIG